MTDRDHAARIEPRRVLRTGANFDFIHCVRLDERKLSLKTFEPYIGRRRRRWTSSSPSPRSRRSSTSGPPTASSTHRPSPGASFTAGDLHESLQGEHLHGIGEYCIDLDDPWGMFARRHPRRMLTLSAALGYYGLFPADSYPDTHTHKATRGRRPELAPPDHRVPGPPPLPRLAPDRRPHPPLRPPPPAARRRGRLRGARGRGRGRLLRRALLPRRLRRLPPPHPLRPRRAPRGRDRGLRRPDDQQPGRAARPRRRRRLPRGPRGLSPAPQARPRPRDRARRVPRHRARARPRRRPSSSGRASATTPTPPRTPSGWCDWDLIRARGEALSLAKFSRAPPRTERLEFLGTPAPMGGVTSRLLRARRPRISQTNRPAKEARWPTEEQGPHGSPWHTDNEAVRARTHPSREVASGQG